MIAKNEVVTVTLDDNNDSSNTYVVYEVLSDGRCLLFHPICPNTFIIRNIDDLNKVQPNIKDSCERNLNFAESNKEYLDYNTAIDLEALSLYFAIKRKMTPRQKYILSGICGNIASIKFNNDINKAMQYITKNQGILDDFNKMWFNNFKGLFSGQQPITSKKQRAAIFNMAGFAMAELYNPIVQKA